MEDSSINTNGGGGGVIALRKPKEPTPKTKHPLLMEDILLEIFSYFDGDYQNLCSFRSTCQTWNVVANIYVKKSLRWKIGPSGSDKGLCEFMELVPNTPDKSLFRNFHLYEVDNPDPHAYKIQTLAEQNTIQRFMATFGPLVIELKLNGLDANYVNTYLGSFPNLEKLELYNLSLERNPCPYKEVAFPNLKSITFFPTTATVSPLSIAAMTRLNEVSTICNNIINNSSKLQSFNIYWDLVKSSVLQNFIHFEALTTLQLAQKRNYSSVILTRRDISVIKNNYSNLKIFSACVTARHEKRVHGLIAKLAPLLEKLELFRTESRADEDEQRDSDDEIPEHPHQVIPQDVRKFKLPSCPRLKSLLLHHWQLYNYFSFDMPVLTCIDFKLLPCDLPLEGEPNRLQSVSQLKFGPHLVTVGMIKFLGIILPNLEQLQINVENDNALRAIYTAMSGLKRLNLGRSLISDSGIIGISEDNINAKLQDSNVYPIRESSGIDVGALREFPFIGDLKGLQTFIFNRHTLSQHSVYCGFVFLRDLTHLKLPPYHNRGDTYLYIEKVPIRPLVDKCSALVKIDMNGFNGYTSETSDSDNEDNYVSVPTSEIKGCGLLDDDIKYIQKKYPCIEIMYREKKSLSQREREVENDRYDEDDY